MANPTEGIALPVKQEKADELAEKNDKLTDRQKQLVVTLVAEGLNIRAAAEKIGAHRTWAYRALQKEHVKEYMDDLRQASMGALRTRATAVAHQLLSDGSNRQKLELVQTLLGQEEKKEEGPTQAVQVNINLGE